MTSWQQFAVGVLLVLAGSGGGVAVVRAIMDRPKTRADAVKIIADAATVTVDNISKRLTAVENQSEQQGHEIRHLNDYVDRVSHWGERHRAYDVAAQNGTQLPPYESFPEFVEWRSVAPIGGNHA